MPRLLLGPVYVARPQEVLRPCVGDRNQHAHVAHALGGPRGLVEERTGLWLVPVPPGSARAQPAPAPRWVPSPRRAEYGLRIAQSAVPVTAFQPEPRPAPPRIGR